MADEKTARAARLQELNQARERALKLGDIRSDGGVLSVPLWYPSVKDRERTSDHPIEVEVGLVDVRAADSIRISYDFKRDGYVIKQASKFEFEIGGVMDADWKEVAFVKAWQREEGRESDG